MPSTNAPTLPALFTERQDFWRPWWWLALAIPLALGLVSFFMVDRVPAPTGLKWLVLVVPAILTMVIFALLRLETHLDKEGISYRLYPMSWRRVAWAEIKSAHVRKYSPLGEYGGWGIRGLSTSNYAYNVAGSYGLQLELHNGHRVLLGTQQPEALRQFIVQLRPEQVH